MSDSLKILALHGRGLSATILKQQFGKTGLGTAVSSVADLTFMDAPIELKKNEVDEAVAKTFEGPHYGYWGNAQEGTFRMEDFRRTMDNVVSKLGSNEFDGLIGFSEGATVAYLIICLQHKGKLPQNIPALRFAIFMSAYNVPEQAKEVGLGWLVEGVRDFPSIHLIGERDFIKQGSEKLAKSFVQPTVMMHPKGHVVPHLESSQEETLQAFLAQFKEQKDESACRL